jgi:DNA-binding transcriptional LysR family regulator
MPAGYHTAMMNLRHIQIFHTIMQAGSISGAAKLLHVTQPTLSQALRHAEDQLGYPLFIRTAGHIQPTAAAHTLYRHTKTLMAQLQQVQKISANLHKTIATPLTVGVVPALSFSVLPTAMQAFLADYPNIQVRIESIQHDQIEAALTAQDIDIAVAFCPEHIQTSYACDLLGHGHVMAVAPKALSPHHAEMLPCPLHALAGLPIISITNSGPVGHRVAQAMQSQGVHMPCRISCSTYHTATSLAQQGLGIALVDNFTAHAFASQDVDIFPISDIAPFSVGAISRQAMRQHQQDFLDHITHTLHTTSTKT